MPLTSLKARLRRLELTTQAAGCPACRVRRGRVVVHAYRQMTDGTVRPDGDEPQPCDVCGEVPEEVIEIVDVVVATREEAAQWQARAPEGRSGFGVALP